MSRGETCDRLIGPKPLPAVCLGFGASRGARPACIPVHPPMPAERVRRTGRVKILVNMRTSRLRVARNLSRWFQRSMWNALGPTHRVKKRPRRGHSRTFLPRHLKSAAVPFAALDKCKNTRSKEGHPAPRSSASVGTRAPIMPSTTSRCTSAAAGRGPGVCSKAKCLARAAASSFG